MGASLDAVGLFQPASPEARRTLSERGQPRAFAAGEVVLRQGESATSMHVIVSGRVRVVRETADGSSIVTLAELGANEVVGEMGVLDGGPRTATVTALEPTQTLEIHRTLLAVVLVQHPEVAAQLLRTLSQRLRTADDIIDSLARTASTEMKDQQQGKGLDRSRRT